MSFIKTEDAIAIRNEIGDLPHVSSVKDDLKLLHSTETEDQGQRVIEFNDIKRKADKGVTRYQALLSALYINGVTGDSVSDDQKALYYATKSVEEDNPIGHYVLWRFYASTGYFNENKTKSRKHKNLSLQYVDEFAKSPSNEDPLSQYMIYKIYSLGDDDINTLKFLEKAADLGHSVTQRDRMRAYDFGYYGLTKDREKVKYYAKKFAETENLDSHGLYLLAFYYMNGKRGFKVDVEKGLELLEQAIYLPGSNKALGFLVGIYRNGKYGVKSDIDKAIYYSKIAYEQGNCGLLAALYQKGLYKGDNNYNDTDVAACDKKHADSGSWYHMYEIGKRYKYGIGVETNATLAHRYLSLAAEIGGGSRRHSNFSIPKVLTGVMRDAVRSESIKGLEDHIAYR